MSEAYERERQNNDSLSALSSKVTALRNVTIDIYDNARDQHVIDSTSDTFSNMTTSLKGSARRLGTMAGQGNKVAVLKLAGILVGDGVLLLELSGGEKEELAFYGHILRRLQRRTSFTTSGPPLSRTSRIRAVQPTAMC
ncbi:hypothetical protein TI39_contig332g00004 [Zymoseptoria brevis]|uniref:t-SNARE coiled-coil homology domain-containing protein n=1 Tax=Zymoseptoria brevis TaxID=1047168 RepID=A0A0F4GSH2_9PEZI|nr:hypothetical protein TI39_contig332g00004 [Zymoseptoria brevis]